MSNSNDKNASYLNSHKGEQQKVGDDESFAKTIVRTAKGVKRRYCYLKTVYSMQELDDFRFEECRFHTKWLAGNSKMFQLRCRKEYLVQGNSNSGGCPFALLAWRPWPNQKQIRVYASNDEHNHPLTSTDKMPARKREMWSEKEEPPHSFNTPNGRHWTFLETTAKSEFVNLHENLKRKYNCFNPKNKMGEKLCRVVCHATLYCTIGRMSDCKFQLLAQRTDQGRYFLYASGAHTCKHEGKVITRKPLTKWREVENEQERQDEMGEEEDEEGDDKMEVQEEDEKEEEEELEVGKMEDNEEEEESIVQRKVEGRNSDNDEKEEEDVTLYLGRDAIWPDAHPPATFTIAANGREWTFVETTAETDKEKAFANLLLENLKPKYHCRHSKIKLLERFVHRATMFCTNVGRSGCKFKLLAQRTDRGRYHVYTSGQHTCLHANKDEQAARRNAACWPDAEEPPASFHTQKKPNCREWTFLETTTTAGRKWTDLLGNIKRKYKCRHWGSTMTDRTVVCRATLYCMMYTSSKCKFALLAQRTDQGRYHLYESGEHTCKYKEKVNKNKTIELEQMGEKTAAEDEELKQKHLMWSDEEKPPASFATPNGCQWTFLKSIDEGLLNQLDNLKRRYHCYYASRKKMEKLHRTVYRAKLMCTTSGGIDHYNCKFQLLAQRTDRGRYHLYTSGQHSCMYKNKVKSLAKEEWQEQAVKEEGVKEEVDNEEGEDEIEKEPGEPEEQDEEDIGDEIKEENGEEEDGMEDYEEENDEEAANGVQFVDFVDHPKCEGVKMCQLGEPKKEPGANVVTMVTIEEEKSPTNSKQNLKVPKQEIKEEVAAAEEDPGLLDRGGHQKQQQRTNEAKIAPPMAVINRQNHQQSAVIPVMERWWAKHVVDNQQQAAATPNNEQRLLRERKHRINYRE